MLIYTDKLSPFELRQRLLLYIPMFFGVGIGLYFLTDLNISNYILGVISVFAIIGILIFQNKKAIPFVALFFITLGYITTTIHANFNKTPLYRPFYNLLIEGDIVNIELYPSAQRLLLENLSVVGKDWKNFPKTVRIKVNGLREDLKVGNRIRVRATLMPPSPPLYPNSYDFATKAWFDGISAVGYNTGKIKIIGTNTEKLSLFEKINNYMQNLRNDIAVKIKNILPKEKSGIATALITGEQSLIDKTTIQNYRDTGLVHILSVSGMHMSMLALLVFMTLRTILSLFPRIVLYYNTKKISAVIALIISFIYLLLSGGEIPAQRAFIMVFVAFSAILINRRAISMRSVAIAGLFIMIISPQSVTSPGFQMSFAAVAALIAYYENRYVNRGKNISSMLLIYFYVIILTAFIGTITTAPYAIYHFNRFPSFSILANLFVSTIFSITIMPFLLLGVLLMPFGISEFAFKIAGFGIEWMNYIAYEFADFPYAVILLPQTPMWTILLLSFGLYMFILGKSRFKYLYLLLVLPMFISFYTYKKPDFIINDDASLIAINHHDEIILSPGRGNRMQREIWMSANASEYNKKSRKQSKEYFATICKNKKCIVNIKNCHFEFIIDDRNSFKVYKNNELYQKFTENDLSKNEIMLFYIEKNDIIIKTVNDNFIKRWD